jgi:type IV secretory pathway VirD2 relaxase
MSNDGDDRFRPKVGTPKARGRAPKSRFVGRVLKATSKAGRTIGNSLGNTVNASRSRTGAKFGRGHVAARLAGRSLGPRARRVVTKTRLANLRTASPRSTQKHLRYIERDGVTRDGGRGQLYGAHTDRADAEEFAARGKDDRHQFRVIVSPEDANDLEDLKSFTREFMGQMERDLGTKLEWVAVDHWDTDDPHTHVVIRGKDEHGRDLIIAPDYIAHGMRHRAAELATEWLGPRTELEIRETLSREVTQERWTSLDRTLQEQSRDGEVSLRYDPPDAAGRFRRGLLIGRLDCLADMGLASKTAPGVYRLDPDLESTLRQMGERGDIIRTMQRAFTDTHREHAIFDESDLKARVVGRIAGKGLADELSDRGYLIVDGVDGRAHYVALPTRAELADFPIGGIVEVRGGVEVRAADRRIDQMAENGIYRTERHLNAAREQHREGRDPQTFVESHVRRLEALRRAGIVHRIEEGVWRVPADLIERGTAYDSRRAAGARIELRSPLTLHQQTRAIGATWLDRQLIIGSEVLASSGFGADVRAALAQRADFLIDQGLAKRQGHRALLAQNLLATLREREIESTARSIETETGLSYRPVIDGQKVSGTYRRSITLASGRFAMLDDATGFSLVPWRPVIEKRLGQSMSAIVRDDFVSWEIGRQRGLSI